MQVNRERELLRAAMNSLRGLTPHTSSYSDAQVVIGQIQQLLAQPEQTEPELNQESRSKPFRGLELNGDSYPPEYIEESPMYDMTIHDNPDALAWTRFFMETHPSCNVDDQTMFGWFANAMRAMHDHTCRNTSPPKREPLEPAQYWVETSWYGQSFEWQDGFTDGVLYSEEHHGIGK